MKGLEVVTSAHDQLLDITTMIEEQVPPGFEGGILLYTPHTSAAIMINEGADPDVQTDILGYLNRQVVWDDPHFDHAEGNSAAHIKAMLVGNDQMVIVKDGQLQLGTWERVFFCEFDGPRTRKVWLQLLERGD